MSNVEKPIKEHVPAIDQRTSPKMQGKIPDIFKFIWAPQPQQTGDINLK